MKVRESGMPDEDVWKNFFNLENIINTLGLDSNIIDVAEFGCGYGTFTIPVAKVITGNIYAIDIEEQMVEETKDKATLNELTNVKTMRRDFMTNGTGLSSECVDYVMLFNILHVDEPERLLKEAYRILKPKGKLGIIHWNFDPTTPRGPPMDIRPKPEQCVMWAENNGFNSPKQYALKPYHYGILLRKI